MVHPSMGQPVVWASNADPQNPTPWGWLIDTLCFPASLLEEGKEYCSEATYTDSFQRCDDDIGYMKDGLNVMETKKGFKYVSVPVTYVYYGPCYIYEKGMYVQTSYKQTTYNYAWIRKRACDRNVCEVGQMFSDCKRHNPGKCTPCTDPLMKGFHFSARGACDQAECSLAPAGFYIATGCSRTENAGMKPCAEHPENVRRPLNEAKYYCPGGLIDLIQVPPNARVTDSTYLGFTCNDGYFKNEQRDGCTICAKGHYCRGGVSTPCKVHYHSDKFGSTKCSRCIRPSDCTSESCGDSVALVVEDNDCGNAPTLCKEGSVENSQCISCGLCGDWPQTGSNCVLGYEMDALPQFDPM